MSPASSEFLEQAVKIVSITYLLPRMLPMGVEHGCEAVFLGFSIGECSSCLYLILFYAADNKRLKQEKCAKLPRLILPIFKIALPITANSLFNSFLRMYEEVLIVSSLRRSGLKHSVALSLYGGLHGMVMPLIVFPLTLLSSCFTMLVPEISRAYALKNPVRLKTLVSKIYRFCTLLGFLVMCIIVTFSTELAAVVYNAPEISQYLKIMALLTPFMFMDSVSCGILNGMGKQGTLLAYSLTDSLLRIGLIVAVVPRYGIGAFVFVIIASNLFTSALTMRRVLAVSGLHFAWIGWFLKHMISAAVAWFISSSFLLGVMQSNTVSVACGILATALIYFAAEAVSNMNMRSDAAWLVNRMFFNT
jgi:stage V sporulation protein B